MVDGHGCCFGEGLMEINIASFVNELTNRCWRCIQDETKPVITCHDMWDQDVMMLRQILRLDYCTVPEIDLFNVAREWAERQCRKTGCKVNPENLREVLGQ